MPSHDDRVTVLMSVRNGERFVARAVRSVLRQTLRDFEFIVIDDGSTDTTGEVLAGFDDRRMRVIRQEDAQGLASSLRRGVLEARGRYVARLDADDVAAPDRLSRQMAELRANPSLGLLGTAALTIDETDRLDQLLEMPRGPLCVRWSALFGAPFVHPSVVFDRVLFERHALTYDPAFLESEDYDLWTRALEFTDGDNLRRPLVLYRVHGAQASQRRRDLQVRFQEEVALRTMRLTLPSHEADDAELNAAWEFVVRGDRAGVEPYFRLLDAFTSHFRSRPGLSAVRSSAARMAARRLAGDRRLLRQQLPTLLRLDPMFGADALVLRARRYGAAALARRRSRSAIAET
jgi:glycosyltransferase involved in cell wall biosynthesis